MADGRLFVWAVFVDQEFRELFTTLKAAQTRMKRVFASYSVEVRRIDVLGEMSDENRN